MTYGIFASDWTNSSSTSNLVGSSSETGRDWSLLISLITRETSCVWMDAPVVSCTESGLKCKIWA